MSSSATAPMASASRRSSSSARRVLSGVGRPLRRVSRGLFASRRTRSPAPGDSSTTHDGYGSIMEEDCGSSLHSDPVLLEPNHHHHLVSPVAGSGPQNVHSHQHRDDRDWVVYGFEIVLLRILVVLGAFLLGAYHPQWTMYVWRATEYVGVAWITCVVIMVASHVQQYWMEHEHPVMHEQQEAIPLLAENGQVINGTAPRQLDTDFHVVEAAPMLEDNEAQAATSPLSLDLVPPTQNHPELEHLYIFDATNGERMEPNNPLKPYKMDNDLFEGNVLIMFRTSDADDAQAPIGTEANSMVSDYLRHKQRRFEFQYQLKLKEVPEGRIFFACQVEEPVKMGMIQRAFVGASMSFVKKMNNGFHYSLTSPTSDNGKSELPHIAFTVEGSMDRLVITKPGETPPKLGSVIEEDAESIRRRKKGNVKIDWNTEDTYTFAMWSAYCDFISWRVINLPGVRPFYMSSVTGDQHVNLTLYVIPPTVKGDKHYRCDMQIVANLEISNTRETMLGPCAKAWVEKNTTAQKEETLVLANIPEEEPNDIPKLYSHDDEDEDFVEEEDQDWATMAELGEGIYLRSGDSVLLKETVGDGAGLMEDGLGYVTMAGGFAVVQNQASSTIVIEKARRSRDRSKLIKSGDTVMIKLVTKGRNGEQTDTKYLSVHRGWWLKWVSIAPTKNGYFTIYTHETEFDLKDGKPLPSSETQTSFLTLNGTFWLRHKRWSKYQVGVSVEESPTYGGRILGLCRHDSLSMGADEVAAAPSAEDEEEKLDMQPDASDADGKTKQKWMRPLYFVSQEASSTVPRPIKTPSTLSLRTTSGTSVEQFAEPETLIENIDVPVWVEMMHRTDRRPALVYAVRVVERVISEDDGNNDVQAAEAMIRCYLRTGRNVAEIIRAFQSQDLTKCESDEGSPGKPTPLPPRERGRSTSQDFARKMGSDGSMDISLPKERQSSRSYSDRDGRVQENKLRPVSSALNLKAPVSPRRNESDIDDGDNEANQEDALSTKEVLSSPDNGVQAATLQRNVSLDGSFVDQDEGNDYRFESNVTDDQLGSDSESLESVEGLSSADEYYDADPDSGAAATLPLDLQSRSSKRRRKIMGKIAKSMKAGTSMTGKQVVKQSKKMGKGTVSAGKAIISPISVRPKKPPLREPKSKVKSTERRSNRRRKVRDHHVAVSKAVRGLERRRSQKWLSHPPSVLAGQLCAPDQSCRTSSHVLSKMATSSGKFNKMLSRQLASPSDLDRWFLQGGSVELGIVPSKSDLIHESLVARCLWESHWREEWCGIYETGVVFYAPLTKKPSLDISFTDMQSVRRVDPVSGGSPLPGFPLVVIETAWRCHYMAFSGEESRKNFLSKISAAIFLSSNADAKEKTKDKRSREKDLWKARFWQGFQNSVESSLSGGTGKWAKISSGSKMLHRTVLNSRRMVFDIDSLSSTEEGDDICEMKTIGNFVKDLLSKSLKFSSNGLERDPDAFVQFLDATSRLRSLSLENIDFSGEDAFCIFVNLYHCLLQHALLLSVNGPCHKRSVGHFMRCTCYEIGGDVFSLAELNSCVIRGKMSRAVSPKPPYVEAPKKSNTYRFYALDFVDPRTNFLLNTADISCPQAVPVLTPEHLEEELKTSTTIFIRDQISVDVQKRLILLPKICDVYRKDFGSGEAKNCLVYCIHYLTDHEKVQVANVMRDDHSAVKYQPACDQFHLFLTRRERDAKNDNVAFISDSKSIDALERSNVVGWENLDMGNMSPE